MRFRSKLDMWYIAFACALGVLGVWMVVQSVIERDALRFGAALPVLLLELLLIIPLGFSTWYEFEDEHLHIHAWGIMDSRLHYGLVTAIRATSDRSLAPALSFDRIDIEFFSNGERLHVYVSPKERERFIRLLEIKTGRRFVDYGQQ